MTTTDENPSSGSDPKRERISDTQLKQRLQEMDEYDFEYLVADLWAEQGWNTEVTQASSDSGIDVRCTKQLPYPQKLLVQAKRHSESNSIGGPKIQQYASLKQQEDDVDSVVVVTTGDFTRSARDRAKKLNVKLLNSDDLIKMINRLDIAEKLDQYIEIWSYDSDKDNESTVHSRTNKINEKENIGIEHIPKYNLKYIAEENYSFSSYIDEDNCHEFVNSERHFHSDDYDVSTSEVIRLAYSDNREKGTINGENSQFYTSFMNSDEAADLLGNIGRRGHFHPKYVSATLRDLPGDPKIAIGRRSGPDLQIWTEKPIVVIRELSDIEPGFLDSHLKRGYAPDGPNEIVGIHHAEFYPIEIGIPAPFQVAELESHPPPLLNSGTPTLLTAWWGNDEFVARMNSRSRN